MRITFDPRKRDATLAARQLDFAGAEVVFASAFVTLVDDRQDYGEIRRQTVGRLGEAVVMVVWTERGEARHVISMRKCNERERKRYAGTVGRS